MVGTASTMREAANAHSGDASREPGSIPPNPPHQPRTSQTLIVIMRLVSLLQHLCHDHDRQAAGRTRRRFAKETIWHISPRSGIPAASLLYRYATFSRANRPGVARGVVTHRAGQLIRQPNPGAGFK